MLPSGAWIELDLRLVKREAGRFVTDLGKGGEHGEVFDSGKLAYWGLQSAGKGTHATAMQVGGFDRNSKDRPGLIGSIAKQFGLRRGGRINS